MQFFQALVVFVLGLLVGSFLNVCIYRIPLEKTIVKGRSYCPSCNALIPWYLNIPLVSYLALGGKCRDCKASISPVYPIVELANGLLFLAAYAVFGLTVTGLLAASVFSALLVISVIDYRIQIIPDGIVIFLAIVGLANALFQILYLGAPWHLYVIGIFAASLPLLILGLLYQDGVGGGDIKLMAAIGLFAGWKIAFLSLFLGAVYGLIYALVLLLLRQKVGRKTAIPFGPFLSLGILTSILVGDRLIGWYLSLLF
jgi:leader peptidase (prepilin peptidase)/N-methyltransferase